MWLVRASWLLAFGCTEYTVKAGSPDPSPPEAPAAPDGVCPSEFALDRVGAQQEYDWDEGGGSRWYSAVRYAGYGEDAATGLPVLVEERSNPDGVVEMRPHYLCDNSNVWLVAQVANADEQRCPCEERDCMFPNYAYDPPLLFWWADGVAEGARWSSTTTGALNYTTVVDCVTTTGGQEFFEGMVFERSSLGAEEITTAAGVFSSDHITEEWDTYPSPIDLWYSADVGGLVRLDGFPGLYELSSYTLPE
jgi:hypothetical protein